MYGIYMNMQHRFEHFLTGNIYNIIIHNPVRVLLNKGTHRMHIFSHDSVNAPRYLHYTYM